MNVRMSVSRAFTWTLMVSLLSATTAEAAPPRQKTRVNVTRASLPISMSRPNAISFEFLGRGMLYSLNYDRSIHPHISFGVGFSQFWLNSPITYGRRSYTIVPMHFSFYTSPHSHRGYFSVGADAVLMGGSEEKTDSGTSTLHAAGGIVPVFGFGYEYRGDSGFLFRISPYLLTNFDQVQPFGGFSLGGAF